MRIVRISDGHTKDLELAVRVTEAPHCRIVDVARDPFSMNHQNGASCTELVSIGDIIIIDPPDPEWLKGATMSRLERCVLVLQVVVEDRAAGFVYYHQYNCITGALSPREVYLVPLTRDFDRIWHNRVTIVQTMVVLDPNSGHRRRLDGPREEFCLFGCAGLASRHHRVESDPGHRVLSELALVTVRVGTCEDVDSVRFFLGSIEDQVLRIRHLEDAKHGDICPGHLEGSSKQLCRRHQPCPDTS